MIDEGLGQLHVLGTHAPDFVPAGTSLPAPRTYPDGFCAMASTGMLGALSGASPTVPSVWRLRRDRAASRERPCRSG